MSNSINFSQVNFKGSTNLLDKFKNQQGITEAPTAPEPAPVTASGAEALASYNKASVFSAQNSQPVNEQPKTNEFADLALEPTKIKEFDKDFIANFKGDTVKTALGTVAYYEEKDGDISKIYVANPEGKLSTALEVNNKNGNLIREDDFDENGNPSAVIEYNPETGITNKATYFDKETGKADVVVLHDETGNPAQNVCYDKDGKMKHAFKLDKGIDGGAEVAYEFENGEVKTRYKRTVDGQPLETTIFLNGKEINTFKNVAAPVINTTDIDLSKIDVKPLEVGNIEFDITKVNGEKKLRSNNTLEEIRVKDGDKETVYTMDLTGNKLVDVSEWENGVQKKSVRLSNETGKIDCITESNENGIVKSTYFDKSGNLEAITEHKNEVNQHDLRSVFYTPDGKVRGYDVSDKDGNLKALFNFDKDGNLTEVYEYDKDGKDIDKYYNDTIVKCDNSTQDPKNAEKVAQFKANLNDNNWTKEYIPNSNIIFMKQNGVTDGLEYEIFSNGTVREIGCWTKSNVIMNSNQEMADYFKANKQPKN